MSSYAALAEVYDKHTLPIQVCISAAILLTWYFSLKTYLHRPPQSPVTPKQSAWILSLLVSMISTPVGVYYGLELLKPDWKNARLLEADAFSDFMTVLFIVYFVLDTFFGLLDYGSEFGVLTGWIHHTGYMAFLTHALYRRYTVSFSYTLIMESSSIFLAGGRIFPKYLRQDILFGILYLAFRIIYHLYLLWHIYSVQDPHVIIWPVVTAIFVLHAFWFWQFVSGLKRRLGKQKGAGKNGNKGE